MRKINYKQKEQRTEQLLKLIEEHPSAIQLNLCKLRQEACLHVNTYQRLRRTWNGMKHSVHFRVK